MTDITHIIIDGTDGTGKTTVCTKLGQRLSLPVIKMPNMKEYVEKGSAEEFSKLFNETIIQFSEFDFIMDRGFPSSLVYNKVFKRNFDTGYTTSIQNILQPEIFIMTGEIREDTSGLSGTFFDYFRKDELFNSSEVSKVDEAFVKLSQSMGWNLIHVWEKSPDQIVDFIIKKLRESR